MSIAWADVTAIAPELTSTAVATATQTIILAMVNERMVDGDAWGDYADDGRRYLAAHMATVSGAGAGAGAVTSESIGPLSRSYAAVDGDLGTTKYGVFYRTLLRVAVGPAVLIP
jgi:hypothetical protein